MGSRVPERRSELAARARRERLARHSVSLSDSRVSEAREPHTASLCSGRSAEGAVRGDDARRVMLSCLCVRRAAAHGT